MLRKCTNDYVSTLWEAAPRLLNRHSQSYQGLDYGDALGTKCEGGVNYTPIGKRVVNVYIPHCRACVEIMVCLVRE
jgi:hypothetical protein